VWHLLTHTSGLTYGFHHAHPVDEIYRRHGYEWGVPKGTDLATACAAWAGFPLVFQPGAEWNYSVSTDVLGRVVEVVSGQPLDEFFAERILGPLGMTETSFGVPEGDAERLAACTARTRGLAGSPATTRWVAPRCTDRRSCPAAAGWCPARRTTTGSPDAAARR